MKHFITGLQHIGLPTKNYEASVDFYQKLGFEKIYETFQPNGGRVGFYRFQNLEMEIYEDASPVGHTGAINHIALDCTDIEAAFAKAQELGFPIVSDGIEALNYWENGIRFFHVTGPDEERIEICQIL